MLMCNSGNQKSLFKEAALAEFAHFHSVKHLVKNSNFSQTLVLYPSMNNILPKKLVEGMFLEKIFI